MAVDVVKKLSKLLQSNSNSQQQKDALQQTIDKLSREDILKAIPDVVHSNGAPNLIRLIFEGLSNTTQHRSNLLLNVMKSILTELCDSEAVPENCAVDIVHLMSLNSHDLSSNNLAELVQLCLSFIEKGKNLKGKWLSLFPMIFSELAKQNRVNVEGNTLTGEEYCSEIINSLCETEIATDDAVAFTAVLRELKIPPSTVNKFVLKLCAIVPEMEPQEVPPFVYQLLFLCYQSDHLVPLQHLTKYFDYKLRRCGQIANLLSSRGNSMDIESEIESGSPKEILQAKATSIFHISRAAATGHPLGKEFVKFLRSKVDVPELVLDPFILEVALSLGALPQLRDIIDLLRKIVQRLLRSNERQRHSSWMRELMLGKQIDIQKILDTIMQQGTSEGDNIVKGFELFAFGLLEIRTPSAFGRPGVAGSSAATANASSSTGSTSATVTEQCWQIGSHILLQMIRKFPDSASLIVKKLVERLQDVSNDSQYITTISLMVQHNPLSMLECKLSFTALLYSMEYRGLPSAKRLYSGISPLFRSSGALRDSAFLVLRKLLHSCLEEVRQVAVVGFLQILKNFRFYTPTLSSSHSQTSMSSQATVDVHHSQTSNSNRAFCGELLKLLHCALSQQAAVRLTLYQNLPEVVSRNPELLPECIKMLRCHLKFFVDPEALIQVEMCVSKDGHDSHVVEPLGHLIQSILQTILRSGKNQHITKEDIDPKSEDQVDLGVLSVRKAVTSVAESSFDDYTLGDVQEPCAHLKVQILSSVCVALADFCLAQNATTSIPAAKRLVQLYDMHARFDALLTESSGKGKGKGKAPKKTKNNKDKENSVEESPQKDEAPKAPKKIFEMCTLSLHSIALFINFLNERDRVNRNEEDIFKFFKSQNGLRLWVVQSALTKYQAFRNTGDIEGLSAESVSKFSGSIGCALLLHCQKATKLPEGPLSVMYCAALNCLLEIIQGFCKHHPTKLGRLLMAMDQVDRPAAAVPLENQISKSLKHFKDLLNHLLSGRENEDLVAKAVVPVVGTLTVLSDQLDPAGTEYAELFNWMHRLCKDVECTDPFIVKVLINLLTHLNMASESSPSTLDELAREICLAIGTLDDEDEAGPNKLSTVNEETAAVVLTVLIARLDQLIQVVEWALPRIGAVDRGDASPVVEQSIYARLKLVAVALSKLVIADIRPGPNSELILKLTITFYTTMSRVAKKQIKVIIPAFRSLVRSIATQLTTNLNTFIAHLDEKKTEEKGVKRKKGDKDKVIAPKMDRSARSIPALTYASEQYNQAILGVTKRTKEDLSFGSKLGTTRDFRIKADKVNEALEGNAQKSASEPEESEDDEIEATNSGNRSGLNESRGRGTARRSRGRGRGKFTSVGKAHASK